MYRAMQIEGKETQHQQFEVAEPAPKVVPIDSAKRKGKEAKKRG